jgi:hypothetical protein
MQALPGTYAVPVLVPGPNGQSHLAYSVAVGGLGPQTQHAGWQVCRCSFTVQIHSHVATPGPSDVLTFVLECEEDNTALLQMMRSWRCRAGAWSVA